MLQLPLSRCSIDSRNHFQARTIFDIIRAMRTNAKNAVALSLAIAGAVASPMRSDATPPPHSLMDAI